MIPSELVVDGIPWTVSECDTLPEGDGGETRRHEGRTLLADDLSESLKESAFWHEVIHMLFTVRDINLNPNATPEQLEEQVACALGPALYTFLLQNADVLWRYDPPEVH